MIRDRKLNRLKDYDYSREGYYFVTICVKDRIEMLGGVKDGVMVLNGYGRIVEKQWVWLPQRYPYVELDEFIVMPNHFHGILSIVGNGRGNVGNARERSLRKIKSLSELMGAFKTTSSKLIHKSGLSQFQWQKSFHDHIIRGEGLDRIREYIANNPLKWDEDVENEKRHLHNL